MSRNLTITKTGKQTKHGHAHGRLQDDSKVLSSFGFKIKSRIYR